MVSVGNLHNTRIMRFILVLIVVILTIFIYASYSTTTTLIPSHLHVAVNVPPTAQQLVDGRQQQQSAVMTPNNTREFGLSTGEELPGIVRVRQQELHKKPPSLHRLPTIDEDALLDGGAGGASPMAGSEQAQNIADEEDQQYMQGMDAITGNINTNNSNSDSLTVKQSVPSAAAVPAQQQQQPPSDVENLMIPTTNLQKFIENADKILKNMTSNSSNPPAAAPLPSEQRTDKTNQPSLSEDIQINLIDNNNGAEPHAASYVVSPVQTDTAKPKEKLIPPKPQVPKAKVKKAPSQVVNMDPSKGIATEKIYESGHLTEEISAERICPENGLNTKLLILISSAQTHADARMSIRQTWGHYGTRRDIGLAFVLGRGLNGTVNQALTEENYIYGDLIRGNFIDSYNNLTLKTISSLEWADQYCNQAKYILKTDDDMFINVPKLLNFLKQIGKHKQKHVIFGRLAKKWKPIRNKKSKYYVSTDQFPSGVFPNFTTGPAYVITGDIVRDLYMRALKTVYLKLEDVFTTGIVAQSLGIERLHVNEFVNRRISFNPCNIRNAISVHMIKSNEQFDLWKKLLDQTTKYEIRNTANQIFNLNTKSTLKAVDNERRCWARFPLLPQRQETFITFEVQQERILTKKLYEGGHIGNANAKGICPYQGLVMRLFIFITSKPNHAEARLSIRKTWGRKNTNYNIGVAFLVGRSINETLNDALNQENELYGDLIRGHFIDSYYNLTLKSISLLEWVDHNCHRAKFILKTDDDVFINVPKLLNFLNRVESQRKTRSIFGRLFKNKYPERRKTSKYFVSKNEFSNKYPAFTTGPAYLLTGDIVHDLYLQSLNMDYLKLEDVFITGIVAESLGIERWNENQFFNRPIFPCFNKLVNVISTHPITPKEQFTLWKIINNES